MFEANLAPENSSTLHWILGLCATAALAVVSYVLKQLNGRADRLEETVAQHAAQSRQELSAVQTELKTAISIETSQRIAADNEVEARNQAHIDRVLDTMNTHHAETRSDIRELRQIVLKTQTD